MVQDSQTKAAHSVTEEVTVIMKHMRSLRTSLLLGLLIAVMFTFGQMAAFNETNAAMLFWGGRQLEDIIQCLLQLTPFLILAARCGSLLQREIIMTGAVVFTRMNERTVWTSRKLLLIAGECLLIYLSSFVATALLCPADMARMQISLASMTMYFFGGWLYLLALILWYNLFTLYKGTNGGYAFAAVIIASIAVAYVREGHEGFFDALLNPCYSDMFLRHGYLNALINEHIPFSFSLYNAARLLLMTVPAVYLLLRGVNRCEVIGGSVKL